MIDHVETTDSNTTPPTFWKLFLIGTGMALLGNLIGWVICLFFLVVLAEDTVLEGFAWLTILTVWNLIPLGCLIYGALAGWQGPKIAQRRPMHLGRSVALWGFGLGVSTWIVLSVLSWVLVTFMA